MLRRMLNVAVRKKLLVANPCSGVEFPVRVKGLFRPHYVTWSEQEKIEAAAPEYLRNVVPDHYRERAPRLQRTRSDEEVRCRLGECIGLDPGLKNRERRCGSAVDRCGSRGVPKANRNPWLGSVSVSES